MNCWLAAAMASMRSALRKARRNFLLAEAARRKVNHLEKMTVQESSENSSRTPITAMGIGSELLTISQKLTCATMPIQCSEINRFPFSSRLTL